MLREPCFIVQLFFLLLLPLLILHACLAASHQAVRLAKTSTLITFSLVISFYLYMMMMMMIIIMRFLCFVLETVARIIE